MILVLEKEVPYVLPEPYKLVQPFCRIIGRTDPSLPNNSTLGEFKLRKQLKLYLKI